MKNISELVFERQMSMFGYAARFSPNDPAHRIISCGNPPGWKRGRGRPPNTWLKQIEGFCRRVGTDREQDWALTKEDALAYRDMWRGAAKRPSLGASS